MPSWAKIRKVVLGFCVVESSYGKVPRKTMVNKGCLVRLFVKIYLPYLFFKVSSEPKAELELTTPRLTVTSATKWATGCEDLTPCLPSPLSKTCPRLLPFLQKCKLPLQTENHALVLELFPSSQSSKAFNSKQSKCQRDSYFGMWWGGIFWYPSVHTPSLLRPPNPDWAHASSPQ